jgi:hypothetical protein
LKYQKQKEVNGKEQGLFYLRSEEARMWYLGILAKTFLEIISKAEEVRCAVGWHG